jgi:GNAT superfamily N-acetyltransferase
MDLRSALASDWPAPVSFEPLADRRDPRRYVAHDKTRDGTFVRIRAIRPDDRDRLIESFTLLSTESIRARWHGVKTVLTAGEIAAETAVDPDVHVGLVATVWIEGSERIVGVASFFVDPWSEPRRAEVAFSVLDAWQGRGIGSLLFGHLARVARQCGIDELHACLLESNRRMLRVFENCGFPVEIERDGPEVWVRLDLVGSGIAGGRSLAGAS